MTLDFDAARNVMVDSQVRPNKVTDAAILLAMRSLPREDFLPSRLRERAYADESVALGNGRVMLEPMVLARMIQNCPNLRGKRVLVVGAGTGYGAAVLDSCGALVFALESDPALLTIAHAALSAHAPAVTVIEGPLDQGAATRGPFDCIFIEGAVEELPDALSAQIAATGCVVMVRSSQAGGRTAQAVIGRPGAGGMSFSIEFDCAVPALPAFRRAPAFVF